jgi:hypothetical protein
MSFVKCNCNACSGHIEFEERDAGQTVNCLHCGLETKLFIPYVTKVPANKAPQNVRVEIKRGVSPLGIASLVLGIMACIFCWIPLVGLLVLPLALIGSLLAIAGLIMAGVSKKTGFAFAVSGLIVSLLSGMIAIAITGGMAAVFSQTRAQSKQTNQEQVSKPSQQGASSASEWSSSDVRQGDIQIAVKDIGIGPVLLSKITGGFEPTEDYLRIQLSVGNTSSTKKYDFHTWRGSTISTSRDYATLTDNNGNIYKIITFGFAQAIYNTRDESSIYPQQGFTDLVVFEKPVDGIKWIHLELPAANFGGSGMIRFEIPASRISYR